MTVSLYSQEFEYTGTNIIVSNYRKQIIVTDYAKGEMNYAYQSKLYTLPIDCEKAINIIPNPNYIWSSRDDYFACSGNVITIYKNDGSKVKELNFGYGLTFINYNDKLFYYRNIESNTELKWAIYKYDISKDTEEILYEFESKYTIFNPETCVDICYPEIGFLGGGIKGTMYLITDDNLNGYQIFTFIVSTEGKKLWYWKEGTEFDRTMLKKE